MMTQPFKRTKRPIVLGIVGDSASGKTTLATGIAEILGPDKVTSFCTDDYHRYDRKQRMKLGVSALDHAANHIDIMEQHLGLLRSGEPILMPTYDHTRGVAGKPEYIEPHDYIIVEGLHGYATRKLRDCFDVKVFLDPDENLRRKWKIRRDTAERGYRKEDVIKSLERRAADSQSFIRPQRTFADIVVRFYPPGDNATETGAHLNVSHTLRPTLPHPDLTPILEAGTNQGFRLELSRDIDGKPVDVLEIAGDIDNRRAKTMEDLLWNLIPEARHLRDYVGTFRDDANNPVVSHPLALSQLMITYHMVKAALGHHAI